MRVVGVVVRRSERDAEEAREPDALGEGRGAAVAAGVAGDLDVGLVGPEEARVPGGDGPRRKGERTAALLIIMDPPTTDTTPFLDSVTSVLYGSTARLCTTTTRSEVARPWSGMHTVPCTSHMYMLQSYQCTSENALPRR